MKSALITGISGQDGSYLAELLLKKDYKVYGLIRRKSQVDYGNSKHLSRAINFIYGDLTDEISLRNALEESQPDEVYNLAAQSFVGLSWSNPILTTCVNSIGVLNILEAIKVQCPETRFYQASSSEMFGQVSDTFQSESTAFYPKSPYGISKLFGHWITINYRESYNLFACAGILFNHESERRGYEFVTRKITSSIAKIVCGRSEYFEIGNLDSKRDWGHAEDYVKAIYLMLQNEKPKEYVIASGEAHTVREFIELAFRFVGIELYWKGVGVSEEGFCKKTSKMLVKVNPKLFRQTDVDLLLGNAEMARKELGWTKTIFFETLVEKMIVHDLELQKKLNGE